MIWLSLFVLAYVGIACWLAYAMSAFVQDFEWSNFYRLLKITMFWLPMLVWVSFETLKNSYLRRKYGIH